MGHFGFGFHSFIPLIGSLIFLLVFVLFAVTIIKSLFQWGKNNNSPVLTVKARVVAKRTYINHHSHAGNETMSHGSSTQHYITFEVESGDRMELMVGNGDYGMIAEQDEGYLMFQGTRFKEFKRFR